MINFFRFEADFLIQLATLTALCWLTVFLFSFIIIFFGQLIRSIFLIQTFEKVFFFCF